MTDIQNMQEIHDIEPPVQVGMDPLIIKILIGTAALLLIALLLFFLFQYIRKRRKKQAGNDILLLPPPLPPGEAALKELDAIMDLMQTSPRLYYFRLTALLKTFIGKCFHIHAPEMTTQEIIAVLNTIFISIDKGNNNGTRNNNNVFIDNSFGRELFSSAKGFFNTSSMIKYAAVMPSLDQMKEDEIFTRRFIDTVQHHSTTSSKDNLNYKDNQNYKNNQNYKTACERFENEEQGRQ